MHVQILTLFYSLSVSLPLYQFLPLSISVSLISFWKAFRLKFTQSRQHHPVLNSDSSVWSDPQLYLSLPSFRGKERVVNLVQGDPF